MKQSESITKLADALVKAQSEMPEIPLDSENPHYRSKFSSLKAVIDKTRPVFAKHGLVVIQLPSGNENAIGLTTRILHSSGEWIEQEAVMSINSGANPGQDFGKLITYLRRYSLSAAAGVYSDEDTDGEGIGKGTQTTGKKQSQPKVDMDIITDEAWAKWNTLVKQATDLGITVNAVQRDKSTRSELLKHYHNVETLIKKSSEKVGA